MLLPPSNTTTTATMEHRLSSTAATAAVHCHRQMPAPTFVHHRCQELTPAVANRHR